MVIENSIELTRGSRRSWSVDLERVGVTMWVGAATGLVVIGGGMRLAMRGVALLLNMPPSFSLSGTLAILLIGATAGLLMGLLYGLALQQSTTSWRATGALFGLPFTALVAAAFLGLFGQPDGEATLAGPWVGALLFAPLPLLQALSMAYLLRPRATPIKNAPPRRINIGWFALFLALLAWTFVALASLVERVRTPLMISELLDAVGVSFQEVRDVQSLMGLLFLLSFCALHLAAFTRAGHLLPVRLVTMGQLLLAALLMRAEPLLPQLTRATAATTVEWVALLAYLLLCGMVLLYMRASGAWRSVWWALLLFASSFGAVWCTILLLPGLQLRGQMAIQTALTTAPFLGPWLLLPLSLLLSNRQDELTIALDQRLPVV